MQAGNDLEYPLIHFLRVGEWKMDKYCESIAHYLNNNPEEAEFWKQNYSEWCKTAKPRQPQTAETATDESLVDDNRVLLKQIQCTISRMVLSLGWRTRTSQ